jgi:hypothetical protein
LKKRVSEKTGDNMAKGFWTLADTIAVHERWTLKAREVKEPLESTNINRCFSYLPP